MSTTKSTVHFNLKAYVTLTGSSRPGLVGGMIARIPDMTEQHFIDLANEAGADWTDSADPDNGYHFSAQFQAFGIHFVIWDRDGEFRFGQSSGNVPNTTAIIESLGFTAE